MAEKGATTTSVQSGEPILVAATAANPSHTEGTLQNLSVDLTGALRVVTDAAGGDSVNLAQVGGTTVATPELTGRVPTSEPDVLAVNGSTSSATVTTAVATPGVVGWTAHGRVANEPIIFNNSGGGLPTGITSGTTYFVIGGVTLLANSFQISAAAGTGTAINFTGSSTGTQTAIAAASVVSQDTTGYQSLDLQFTSVGSGNTVQIQSSNDNITFNGVTEQSSSAQSASGTTSIGFGPSTGQSYRTGLIGRYLRIAAVTYGSGTITVAGVLRKSPFVPLPGVTPTTGTVAAGATDSGNPVKVGGIYNSTLPVLTGSPAQRGDVQITRNGEVRSALTLINSTGADGVNNNKLGNFFINGQDAGTSYAGVWPFLFNGTSWDRQTKPNLTSRIVSAANTTNATSAKGSAGEVSSITGYNAAAALRFLKLYNKASAPTVGSDTPVWTIALPATTAFDIPIPNGGFYFSTGIAYCLTVLVADADTTALTAADVVALTIIYN